MVWLRRRLSHLCYKPLYWNAEDMREDLQRANLSLWAVLPYQKALTFFGGTARVMWKEKCRQFLFSVSTQAKWNRVISRCESRTIFAFVTILGSPAHACGLRHPPSG